MAVPDEKSRSVGLIDNVIKPQFTHVQVSASKSQSKNYLTLTTLDRLVTVLHQWCTYDRMQIASLQVVSHDVGFTSILADDSILH